MLVLYAFKANLRALGVEGIGLSVIKPKVTDLVPCCHAVITLALGPRFFHNQFCLGMQVLGEILCCVHSVGQVFLSWALVCTLPSYSCHLLQEIQNNGHNSTPFYPLCHFCPLVSELSKSPREVGRLLCNVQFTFKGHGMFRPIVQTIEEELM